jgi:hypothetical protein
MEKLDTQKLRIELARINKSHAWLAGKLGFSRQYMRQLVKTENARCVYRIASILEINIEDLIK